MDGQHTFGKKQKRKKNTTYRVTVVLRFQHTIYWVTPPYISSFPAPKGKAL